MNEEELENIFQRMKIKREEFLSNPFNFIGNKNLVVKIDDQYYNHLNGIANLLSLKIFNSKINENTQEVLMTTDSKKIFIENNQQY